MDDHRQQQTFSSRPVTYHGADLQAKDGFAQHLRPCFQAKTGLCLRSQTFQVLLVLMRFSA